MTPPEIFYAALVALTPPSAEAPNWIQQPAQRAPAAQLRTEGPASLTPGLEVVSFPGEVFGKWQETLSRHRAQIAHNGSAWSGLVANFVQLSPDERVNAVNRLVNRVPYVTDRENWHKSDYWETPLEFFQKGGDCEDYAISKYLLLRELGFSSNQMQIAISKNHAVLIIRSSNGPVVLDNLRYRPYKLGYSTLKNVIFTVNDSAWSTVVSRHRLG